MLEFLKYASLQDACSGSSKTITVKNQERNDEFTLYSVRTSSIFPDMANTTYFRAARERARDCPTPWQTSYRNQFV
jgi:hypothetical protein